MVREGEGKQVSVGSSLLAFLGPLPPPKRAPGPPNPFSSGLHVLGLHLNTHSLTICLGLSEDQWGSQGLAQQGAGGKSLTRARKGTLGVGGSGEKPCWERDMSLGLAFHWGRALEGLVPQW